MWQKTSQVKKFDFVCESVTFFPECDKCDTSHFSSPKKVTNVTSLDQIWDGNLGRNSAETHPNFRTSMPVTLFMIHARSSTFSRGVCIVAGSTAYSLLLYIHRGIWYITESYRYEYPKRVRVVFGVIALKMDPPVCVHPGCVVRWHTRCCSCCQ